MRHGKFVDMRTAQRCVCGRAAHGSIGLVVMCRYCMAEHSGLDQKLFRKPVAIALTNDGEACGTKMWIPWSFYPKKKGV